METVGDRLAQVLKLREISARELDRRAGISEGTVAIIIKRYAKNPQTSTETGTLKALAGGGRVSERWLVLGEGTPDSEDRAPQVETPAATWSAIPGWPDAEAQVRRDHPEWTDETKWSAARSSAPFMAPPGGVQPIHVEELYRLAVRLGAGGDLRVQVDAQAAKVRAEVQAIQEGTMAPRRPPPEKPARRARR